MLKILSSDNFTRAWYWLYSHSLIEYTSRCTDLHIYMHTYTSNIVWLTSDVLVKKRKFRIHPSCSWTRVKLIVEWLLWAENIKIFEKITHEKCNNIYRQFFWIFRLGILRLNIYNSKCTMKRINTKSLHSDMWPSYNVAKLIRDPNPANPPQRNLS